jgi:hypothetical protein
MADSAAPATKTPWHLWVVGVVAVLWNVMGVADFTLTQLKSEAWLKGFTPEQREYIYSFPLWSLIAWGAGVYGGFIGSILLLVRSRWAVAVFRVSLAGAIVTSIYTHGFTDWDKVSGGSAGAVIFSAVIVLIAVLLWFYARAMTRRGVLR